MNKYVLKVVGKSSKNSTVEVGKIVEAKTYRDAMIKLFGDKCFFCTDKGKFWRVRIEWRHRGYCTIKFFDTNSDNKDKYGINNIPDYYNIVKVV